MISSTIRSALLAAAVLALPAVASAQNGATKPSKDIVGVAVDA